MFEGGEVLRAIELELVDGDLRASLLFLVDSFVTLETTPLPQFSMTMPVHLALRRLYHKITRPNHMLLRLLHSNFIHFPALQPPRTRRKTSILGTLQCYRMPFLCLFFHRLLDLLMLHVLSRMLHFIQHGGGVAESFLRAAVH